ncbi:MAG: hypothetical protein JWN50_134 [Parcubacteria group bacterium]|nr:hypothetical protein [Parcubacteria group bacterium]
MYRPDEAVLQEYVAEIKQRIENGMDRFKALNAVLDKYLDKSTHANDRQLIYEVVLDELLRQVGVPIPKAAKPTGTLFATGRIPRRNQNFDVGQLRSGEEAQERADAIAEEFRNANNQDVA